MRSRFDEQLARLNQELIEMGALCEEAISLAAAALAEGDGREAGVAALDREIDQKERDIETLCLKLLLQQQPVARDLRQISAALKMITDMERIGDQAEDIAEIITFLGGRTADEHTRITRMAKATTQMVTDSIDAFVRQDVSIAERVIRSDDIVDDCFVEVKNSLISMIAANPQEGEFALDLLFFSLFFEGIGDLETNIAEWVVFSVTGVHKTEEETV